MLEHPHELIIDSQTLALLQDHPGSLDSYLELGHANILQRYPFIQRVACALYDAERDELRTFLSSTRRGSDLTDYRFELSRSRSLSRLRETGEYRVIDSVQEAIEPRNEHSRWLLEQGYLSSFTIPLFAGGSFMGVLFMDADLEHAFPAEVRSELLMFANMISASIATQVAAARSLLATTRMARDLAGLRDFETGRHLDRIAAFSRLIAEHLRESHGLDDEFINTVAIFAPLHDIGKVGVPDRVLLKEEALSEEEFAIMQGHVTKGLTILEGLLPASGNPPYRSAEMMHNIIAYHHEFLDGTGYPAGVTAEAIPLEARIVAVADILDALTHQRPYKQPWSLERALEELEEMANRGKIDPDCVHALRSDHGNVEELLHQFRDEE